MGIEMRRSEGIGMGIGIRDIKEISVNSNGSNNNKIKTSGVVHTDVRTYPLRSTGPGPGPRRPSGCSGPPCRSWGHLVCSSTGTHSHRRRNRSGVVWCGVVWGGWGGVVIGDMRWCRMGW